MSAWMPALFARALLRAIPMFIIACTGAAAAPSFTEASVPPAKLPAISGTMLTVSPGGQYPDLASAYAASKPGDTIIIAPGSYTGGQAARNADVTIRHDLTIKCQPGAVFDNPATTIDPKNLKAANVAKGYLVIGNQRNLPFTPDVLIDGCTFQHAISFSYNGAGIRYQSGNLTVRNSTFRDNQMHILAPPTVTGSGNITLEKDTFLTGAFAATGLGHALYIGTVKYFTIANSKVIGVYDGHGVKTRAANNLIKDNTIGDGPGEDGQMSYQIEAAENGNTIAEGNTLEKGPHATNSAFIQTGTLDGVAWPDTTIIIRSNTFIDDHDGEGANATGPIRALWNISLTHVQMTGNKFVNMARSFDQDGKNWALQGTVDFTGNVDGNRRPIPDAHLVGYNYSWRTVDYSSSTGPVTYTTPPGPPMTVIGGAGKLTFNNQGRNWTVISGPGGLSVADTGGRLRVITAAGSKSILSLLGSSRYSGYGDDTVTFAGRSNGTGPRPGGNQIYGTAAISEPVDFGLAAYAVTGAATIHMAGGTRHFLGEVYPGGSMSVSGPLGPSLSVGEQGGSLSLDVTQADTGTESIADLRGGCMSVLRGGKADNPITITVMPMEGADLATFNPSPRGFSTAPAISLRRGSYLIHNFDQHLIVNVSSGDQSIAVSNGGNEAVPRERAVTEFRVDATANTGTTMITAFAGGGARFADGRWGKVTTFRLSFSGFTGNPIAAGAETGPDLRLTLINGKTIVLKNTRAGS